MQGTRLQHVRDVDRRLVAIARDIKVLGPLSWPVAVQRQFLHDWQRGKRKLPVVDSAPVDYHAEHAALEALFPLLDPDHPLEAYVLDTARSYALICELLGAIGDAARVTALSSQIYGRPGDPLSGSEKDNLDAARHFLAVSEPYARDAGRADVALVVDAATLADEMRRRIPEVIDGHAINVVLDPTLVSKAAAGATRIRLRDGAAFNGYDLEQLLQHEVFVHSLTALNGRCQPHIASLGLGAPRTTAAQEGLATFAELVTGAIDIGRIRRIALRILAIDAALSGGDFIDVFEFFAANGQSAVESFNSAMRVFRGVPVGGGGAFTKDTVYLHGLMEVHTFFRWALHHNRLQLCHWFVAGRMTLADVARLEPYFLDGTLALPRYQPPWLTRTNGLTAYLAFSVFTNAISIEALGLGAQFGR
jgi:uncharacterized protein (TIGR02421 family)